MKNKRLIYFLIGMGVFTLAYQIGSMSEVSEEDAELFLEEFKDLIEDIDAIGIFLHNTKIALPMFIPGFGTAWGLFSAWSTGYAFASLALLTPLLADLPALALLYASPFGLMELVAYSIGISRSFMIIIMIIQKKPLKPEIKPSLIEVGIMLGLLIAGAYLEFYMITIAQESGMALEF